MTGWPPSPGIVDPGIAAALEAAFGGIPFELRWSLAGTAAVRVLGGPLAPAHAEGPDPAAPWSAVARCGSATGWLLAADAPAAIALDAAVDRHTALVLQHLAAHRAALAGDLLEALTHRLRTDVATLQAVAEGTLAGMFTGPERAEVAREVRDVGHEAQRRLSAAREAMTALAPDTREPEPIADVLRAELDGAGCAVDIDAPAGERPRAALPASAWGACARMLAEALTTDPRLGGDGAAIRITPDPLGWAIAAGPRSGTTRPADWTRRALGPLAGAGYIAAAGGGAACAAVVEADGLQVRLTVPAAPSL
jgi:signal transduction histidine kinase